MPKNQIDTTRVQPVPDMTARELLSEFNQLHGDAVRPGLLSRECISVAVASAFAAEAYEQAICRDSGSIALARAFLQALVDPNHPDLDHLRANAGQS
jgi:hypothetical protein